MIEVELEEQLAENEELLAEPVEVEADGHGDAPKSKVVCDIEWPDAKWGGCYYNASLYVLTDGPKGCWYVEGYVHGPGGEMVQHAWVETNEEILEVSPSVRGCTEYEGLYQTGRAELRKLFNAQFGLGDAPRPDDEPQRQLGGPLYFDSAEV